MSDDRPIDPEALAEVTGPVQVALRRIAAGVDPGIAIRDACLESYARAFEHEHTPVHFYPQLLDEAAPPKPTSRSGVQPAAKPRGSKR